MAGNPIYFHVDFFRLFENIENREIHRIQFRNIRDATNPFELSNEKFHKLFRLNKPATLNLINELSGIADEPARGDTIPFHLQVFASLLFFGHGSYQTTVGENINLGISQPAMSRIVNKISNLISTHLMQRYVKFPTSAEEVRNAKDGFMNGNFNFPYTIGAIDCTHIAIVPPKIDDPIHPAVAYINRKGYHSINVQAIVDSKLMITNINALYPGAVHDAAIWNTSIIQAHLRRKYVEGRRNCYIIGDSGYPIQPWMLTPILNAVPNSPEDHYNRLHRQARNTVERAFGVLKARFRCLRKDRVLHYKHNVAARIICSCAVLHNICRIHNLPDEAYEDDGEDEDNIQLPQNEENRINNDIDELTEGRYVRRQVVNFIQEI